MEHGSKNQAWQSHVLMKKTSARKLRILARLVMNPINTWKSSPVWLITPGFDSCWRWFIVNQIRVPVSFQTVGVFFLKQKSVASKSDGYFGYLFVNFFGVYIPMSSRKTCSTGFSRIPPHLCIRTLLAYHRYSREINRHLEIRAGVREEKFWEYHDSSRAKETKDVWSPLEIPLKTAGYFWANYYRNHYNS